MTEAMKCPRICKPAGRHSKICGFAWLAFGSVLHQGFVPMMWRRPRRPPLLATTALLTPLPALAEVDIPDLGLAISVIVVLGGAATALSWVASLKPRKTDDGQPRSTSLYRVFQARMRAGEFAKLSKNPGEDMEGSSGSSDPKDEELDALVDAYVEGLEDDAEGKGDSLDLKKTSGSGWGKS